MQEVQSIVWIVRSDRYVDRKGLQRCRLLSRIGTMSHIVDVTITNDRALFPGTEAPRICKAESGKRIVYHAVVVYPRNLVSTPPSLSYIRS